MWAMSDRQIKQVAEEKRRLALKAGCSPAKADRYAREVVEYGRKEQQREKGGKR
jgi:hypothetical protein